MASDPIDTFVAVNESIQALKDRGTMLGRLHNFIGIYDECYAQSYNEYVTSIPALTERARAVPAATAATTTPAGESRRLKSSKPLISGRSSAGSVTASCTRQVALCGPRLESVSRSSSEAGSCSSAMACCYLRVPCCRTARRPPSATSAPAQP